MIINNNFVGTMDRLIVRSPFYQVGIPEKLGRTLTFSLSKDCHARDDIGIKASLTADDSLSLGEIAPQPSEVKPRAHKFLSTNYWLL